jgi:large subunit ribosomal protein L19
MNIVQGVEQREVERLSRIRPIVDFAPGDTVRVGLRIRELDHERIQFFEGVCIARKGGTGINASFTVRKISYGHGVEQVFALHSPRIESILVKRRGMVRRARLYYLRARRGRGARIAERQVSGLARQLPSKGVAASKEMANGISAMVALLKALRALKGAAEGAHVCETVAQVRDVVPKIDYGDTGRSDGYELALSIGEHLCPLLFSRDGKVASEARRSLQEVGQWVLGDTTNSGDTNIVAALQHLNVSLVFWLSVIHESGGARVELSAQSVFCVAPSVAPKETVALIDIKVLLEDSRNTEVSLLAESRLEGPERVYMKQRVFERPDFLPSKIITLLIDGQEIYRTSLRRPAELVFVV